MQISAVVAVTTVITVPCTSTKGSSCKRTAKRQNACLITFDCVCGYADILFPCMPVPCCVFPPPANANLALPALVVEPPHATVQVRHEASASYVSSLAMAA